MMLLGPTPVAVLLGSFGFMEMSLKPRTVKPQTFYLYRNRRDRMFQGTLSVEFQDSFSGTHSCSQNQMPCLLIRIRTHSHPGPWHELPFSKLVYSFISLSYSYLEALMYNSKCVQLHIYNINTARHIDTYIQIYIHLKCAWIHKTDVAWLTVSEQSSENDTSISWCCRISDKSNPHYSANVTNHLEV